MSKLFLSVINILIIMNFIACSSGPKYVPVKESTAFSSKLPQEHVVSKGETLYSIAWRYGLDFRELAKRNRIDKSYRIFPGQKLLLTGRKNTSPVSISKNNNQIKPKNAESVERSIKKTKKVEKKSQNAVDRGPVSWQWPVSRKSSNTFSSNKGLNKGIDIHGNLGDSVAAAASGRVVYSGEGLRGYGKLIILKHSDKYLSAYAHNDRLLVKERQEVKKGQKIAAMGSSGTDSVKLYFEIRYDGKPVNPLKFLPKN